MNFKTCEEYVLSLLEENLNELTRQEEVVRSLNRKLGEIEEKYDTLKALILKYAKYIHLDFHSDYITFHTIWEGMTQDNDFEKLVKLIPEIVNKT